VRRSDDTTSYVRTLSEASATVIADGFASYWGGFSTWPPFSAFKRSKSPRTMN
jgi:hypothetical protein